MEYFDENYQELFDQCGGDEIFTKEWEVISKMLEVEDKNLVSLVTSEDDYFNTEKLQTYLRGFEPVSSSLGVEGEDMYYELFNIPIEGGRTIKIVESLFDISVYMLLTEDKEALSNLVETLPDNPKWK